MIYSHRFDGNTSRPNPAQIARGIAYCFPRDFVRQFLIEGIDGNYPPNIVKPRRVKRAIVAAGGIIVSLLLAINSAHAASMIYVKNESAVELGVSSIDVNGDPLSKKAWKKGKTTISPATREKVLSVNRTGKFNWMDPTPRFIEPGRTVVFSVTLTAHSDAAANDSNPTSKKYLQLRIKLLGTGAGSKMWYATASDNETLEWILDENPAQDPLQQSWNISDTKTLYYVARPFMKNKEMHVEYVISTTPH